MKYCLFIFSWIGFTAAFSQIQPHENAHSHNDYAQTLPLFDALKNGFTSLEADVHLVKGKLLVSHNHPGPSAKSLEKQYLIPLDSIAKRNGGFIYPGYDTPVTLLIDIKTSADDTFAALTKLLSLYQNILSTPAHKRALQIVISGNRPIEKIRHEPNHLSSIDGRPGDLGKGFTSDEMPLISETYSRVMNWNGQGHPSAAALEGLRELAARVHAENKKLRLWAIPDHEHAWNMLLESGVDIVNTDRLQDLSIFLSSRNQ